LAGPSGDDADGRLLPDDAKDALQGVWIAESLKASSNELPADAFKHVNSRFRQSIGDVVGLSLGRR